jgi:hypothetical protein
MSSKHKDLGISAYTPIRTRAHSKFVTGNESDLAFGISLNGAKHDPKHTKPQFKKRRDKHGHVKIIRVR